MYFFYNIYYIIMINEIAIKNWENKVMMINAV